jgi:hypothetical protein
MSVVNIKRIYEELTGGGRISPLVNRTAPTGSRRPSRSLCISATIHIMSDARQVSAINSKYMSVVEHKKNIGIRRTHWGRKNKSRSKSYGSNWVASAIYISACPSPDRDKSPEECNQSAWGPTQSLSPKLTTDAKSKSWWKGNKTYLQSLSVGKEDVEEKR